MCISILTCFKNIHYSLMFVGFKTFLWQNGPKWLLSNNSIDSFSGSYLTLKGFLIVAAYSLEYWVKESKTHKYTIKLRFNWHLQQFSFGIIKWICDKVHWLIFCYWKFCSSSDIWIKITDLGFIGQTILQFTKGW